jgi:chromosome segregation ATPase
MTVEEISTKLDALRTRRSELEARAAQLSTDLEDARRRQGRAIADDAAAKELTAIRNDVRTLEDEQQGVANALEFLAGDIAALEPELVEAERQAAIANAERCNVEATAALEALESTFRTFVVDVLLPAEETWRERNAAASAAQSDAWIRSRNTSEKHYGWQEGYRRIRETPGLEEAIAVVRKCFTGMTFGEQQSNAQARRDVELMLAQRDDSTSTDHHLIPAIP